MAITAEQIVRTAAVIGRNDTVFCLGPFPKRVSFTAQQHRALNLVWALKQERAFLPGDPIAVIGAGLAGITAAAAFAAYGCPVEVYETTGVALSRQRSTDHRMAHPTINRWPMAPLEPTTTLPFLEWYADSCSEVTKTLTEEFSKLGKQAVLKKRHSVVDIVPVGEKLVKLVTDPEIDKPPLFRLVLIAIGFGKERAFDAFKPTDYWVPDSLEILRDQGKPPAFIVSGCGDGGLIDALRVAHGEFEKGHLAFDVAAILTDTPVAKKIKKVELAARRHNTVENLAVTYEGAIQTMLKGGVPSYVEALARLDKSLLGSNPVYLLDHLLDAPYSLHAAPIHKLMIAHAIRRGAVRFRRGSVKKVDNRVSAAGVWFDDDPKSRVVIRHGAEFTFGRLVTDIELADLEKKQEVLSDDHADQHWTGEYPAILNLPKRNPRCGDFIRSRKALAIRAVSKIAVDASLKETTDGFAIQYAAKPPPQSPKTLFGIAVTATTLDTATGIA